MIDSNIAIAALNGVDGVRSRLVDVPRSEVGIPIVAIADLYGSTRAALEARGIGRSDFDLIIASTALDQDAVLVTDDRGLLDAGVDGLRVENWLADGPAATEEDLLRTPDDENTYELVEGEIRASPRGGQRVEDEIDVREAKKALAEMKRKARAE